MTQVSDEIIMAKVKQFFKQNFIYICLIAACLSLLTYLIAFSCELSKILDSRRTTNDTTSILLSIIYFVLFLSATILINGLATRLPMGLLIWSVIFSTLTIPELWLIMMQFWTADSNHGIPDIIFYFFRLVINCTILIHIVPLAIKWRKEKKILKQLESLASRLQLTATPNTVNNNNNNNLMTNGTLQRRNSSSKDIESDAEKCVNGVDNHGYLTSYYGSQNEFDASIFGLNPSQYIGPPIQSNSLSKRTQSLLDLRFINATTTTLTTTEIVSKSKEKSDSISLNSYDMRMQNNLAKNSRNSKALKGSREQIYHTMESPYRKSLGRNCVSLENIGGFYITNDVFAPNFPPQPQPYHPAYFYYNHPYQQQQHPYMMHPFAPTNYFVNQNSGYFNASTSLANISQEDFRKYRDVAL
ncbi:hypothetical protein PVAND_017144 [Polypedilum vanderplanki]|uniref:Uncharacterized protein n=1 Tax=Polypedilum vanderplanki TaxID=319348 RepID=A0A9J6BHD9_POLVA|nr:hypothetical protein PVAND_017144 [Polypedilum vanderplanki]